MGFENNKITAPIDLADVATALGVSREDVGYLCTSAKIKPWAKYKPVRDDSITTNSDTWRGNDGKCGLSVPLQGLTTGTLNKASFIALFTEDGTNGWAYDKLVNGDYLRITDFEGYYAFASAPYSRVNDLEIEIEDTNSITIVPMAANKRDDMLSLSDFGVFFDPQTNEALYHFGAFIVGSNDGGTQYKRVITDLYGTDGKPIIGSAVTIPIADLPIGIYTIYCILASAPIGYDVETGNADRDISISAVPCPCVPPATLTIKSRAARYTYILGTNTKLAFGGVVPTFKFTNEGGKDLTIENLTFSYHPTGTWENISESYNVGNVTVPALVNNVYEYQGRVLSYTSSDMGAMVGVSFTVDGVQEKRMVMFFKPIN